uniref:Translational initiation factor n=2 Tax=Striga asiatica TaxID=4170 RepID=UPI00220DEBA2|nr:Translational initiation factor [Striga asiatica]UXL88515.1 Translational initiation factor [Striga asiatica]
MKKKDNNPKKENNMKKEDKWVREGLIIESLRNGMFRVQVDNEDVILGYISGKIRRGFIRILPGDKVKIEGSRYDLTKGRIIYRLPNKDSKDSNKDSKD